MTNTTEHTDNKVDLDKIKQAVTMILEAVGEDPTREGLEDTPKRVAKMYAEMFAGLHTDAREYFETVFHEGHDDWCCKRVREVWSESKKTKKWRLSRNEEKFIRNVFID